MAPSTAQLKTLSAQFVSLTGASERTAQRYLKNANYKMNDAIDAIYDLPARFVGSPAQSVDCNSRVALLLGHLRRQRTRERPNRCRCRALALKQTRLPCHLMPSEPGAHTSDALSGPPQDRPRTAPGPPPRVPPGCRSPRPNHKTKTALQRTSIGPRKGLSLWSSKKKTDVKQQPGDGTKDKDKDKDKIRSVFFGGSNGGSGAGTPSPLEGDLNKLFDSLRGSSDNKDHMGIDSTTSYLTETLGVNPENAELLVVMEIVQAPAVGEITRKGFVDGWKSTGVQATNKDHAKHIKSLVKKLSTDQALFKKVYRHTFVAAKEQDQKAISLEYAQIYWETLFAPPGWQWASQNHNWLELWNSFLAAKWTRSVNKDMWNMTLEFAYKSLEDETLSFWSEDGAWPSVLDEFVAWCREEKGIKPETMDTDA
ncbi:defective in cullin neddylation protein [Verticillium dahliae VdLs.17]|uniref:Defective in cullin neddylation protein n=1 Tax=Verticillium dahliae (strain VdLs.17 / ATCC MYA-4575 / FGSC 10137) TaxID=498257 RepID=G2XHV2_VERDV|nr:defective in cullin neddylation protein [Verticillium dahliae VdLs.17]EGY19400.1 defective in cullin neddylation protein [Verticillium dahliae VdLs.17]